MRSVDSGSTRADRPPVRDDMLPSSAASASVGARGFHGAFAHPARRGHVELQCDLWQAPWRHQAGRNQAGRAVGDSRA